MVEIQGELWDFYDKPNTFICITTNGTVKADGKCVMGRGCAKEASVKFIYLPAMLGQSIKKHGNVFAALTPRADETGTLFAFPVKHNWWEQANLHLIYDSAVQLDKLAKSMPETTFVLPRPGCGNGHLLWEDVKQTIQFLPDNVKVISK